MPARWQRAARTLGLSATTCRLRSIRSIISSSRTKSPTSAAIAVSSSTCLSRRDAFGSETLDAVADRGYYEGEEIKSCEEAGITVTLPKPQTSSAKAEGRFGKQDFVYVAAEDVYLCPAGERLTYRFASVENGKTIRRYWTSACKSCALKAQCTTGP